MDELHTIFKDADRFMQHSIRTNCRSNTDLLLGPKILACRYSLEDFLNFKVLENYLQYKKVIKLWKSVCFLFSYRFHVICSYKMDAPVHSEPRNVFYTAAIQFLVTNWSDKVRSGQKKQKRAPY